MVSFVLFPIIVLVIMQLRGGRLQQDTMTKSCVLVPSVTNATTDCQNITIWTRRTRQTCRDSTRTLEGFLFYDKCTQSNNIGKLKISTCLCRQTEKKGAYLRRCQDTTLPSTCLTRVEVLYSLTRDCDGSSSQLTFNNTHLTDACKQLGSTFHHASAFCCSIPGKVIEQSSTKTKEDTKNGRTTWPPVAPPRVSDTTTWVLAVVVPVAVIVITVIGCGIKQFRSSNTPVLDRASVLSLQQEEIEIQLKDATSSDRNFDSAVMGNTELNRGMAYDLTKPHPSQMNQGAMFHEPPSPGLGTPKIKSSLKLSAQAAQEKSKIEKQSPKPKTKQQAKSKPKKQVADDSDSTFSDSTDDEVTVSPQKSRKPRKQNSDSYNDFSKSDSPNKLKSSKSSKSSKISKSPKPRKTQKSMSEDYTDKTERTRRDDTRRDDTTRGTTRRGKRRRRSSFHGSPTATITCTTKPLHRRRVKRRSRASGASVAADSDETLASKMNRWMSTKSGRRRRRRSQQYDDDDDDDDTYWSD